MINKQVKALAHYGAMGVFEENLSDNELLHTAIKNIHIIDGFVKSITVFDDSPMAILIVDRASEHPRRFFRKVFHNKHSQITLRLLKPISKANVRELTCAIKPLKIASYNIARKTDAILTSENWIFAFQSKIVENIKRAGGQTFQTFPTI